MNTLISIYANIKSFYSSCVVSKARSHFFRLPIVVMLALYIGTVFFLLYKGSDFHEGVGKASADEYNNVIWTMASVYAPFGAWILYWFQSENWTFSMDDEIFQWQGWFVLIAVLWFSYLSVTELYDIIVTADYAIIDKNVSSQPYTEDDSISLQNRMSKFSMMQSFAWTVLLSIGFLHVKSNNNISDHNQTTARASSEDVSG
ncbi:MAG TPA: hypothetical protein DCY03_05160 [Planctomycetaceae bacterium]|nr:hypothetical protein [Planctomycetaceae bacterium]